MELYAILIQDMDYQATTAVAEEWMRTRSVNEHLRPKPGDLRKAVLACGLTELSAQEAWAMIQADVRELGRGRSPVFRNQILNRTVAQFGWNTFCNADSHSAQVLYSQFVKAYEHNVKKAVHTLISNDAGALPLKDPQRSVQLVEWAGKDH